MVKRKSTLKKKVSKRQTRKFSKKGGRKSMKKPASKQQKIKGGQGLQINTKSNRSKPQQKKKSSLEIAAEHFLTNLKSDLRPEKYHALFDYHRDLITAFGQKFTIEHVLEKCNEIVDGKNNKLRQYDRTNIKNQLVNCNKNGEGKVLLKTPTLSRDYILHKFNIEEREDKLYLVMKHESGEEEEIEIEPFPLIDYEKISSNKINSVKDFEINQQVYEAINKFLVSFDGKGTPEQKTQFLSNISSLLEEPKQDASSDE